VRLLANSSHGARAIGGSSRERETTVARAKSTFGKRDRERANQLKAQQKRERRLSRSADRAASRGSAGASTDASTVDQQELLDRLAALQARFESHEVDLEEFEAQRDELRRQIRI